MTAYPFPSIDPRAQAKVAFGATSASRRVVSHRLQSADSGRSQDWIEIDRVGFSGHSRGIDCPGR
jgi:hypothetical protein